LDEIESTGILMIEIRERNTASKKIVKLIKI